MGLAVSRFWWPAGLARAFADQGFAVARYDQRDAGQSTRMPDTGHANPFVALARRRGGYSSEDMTDDAVAVLDALGWERAHIFGASLGGVIAQRTALRHPDRVLSVVSAMALPSDAVGIKAGRYVRFGTLAAARPGQGPRGQGRGHPALAGARPGAGDPRLPVRRGRRPRVDRARGRRGPAGHQGAEPAGRRSVARPEAARAAGARPRPARRQGPNPARQRRQGHGQRHPRRPSGDPAGGRPRPSRPALAGDRPRGPPARGPASARTI